MSLACEKKVHKILKCGTVPESAGRLGGLSISSLSVISKDESQKKTIKKSENFPYP